MADLHGGHPVKKRAGGQNVHAFLNCCACHIDSPFVSLDTNIAANLSCVKEKMKKWWMFHSLLQDSKKIFQISVENHRQFVD